jgi:erythritol kinase
MDGRATPIVERWTADGVLESAYRRTGGLMFPGASGPLLAWLDAHEPAVLDRAATAAYCKDVVLQQLTGVRATDPSDASMPFLDPRSREYDDDLLKGTAPTPTASRSEPAGWRHWRTQWWQLATTRWAPVPSRQTGCDWR